MDFERFGDQHCFFLRVLVFLGSGPFFNEQLGFQWPQAFLHFFIEHLFFWPESFGRFGLTHLVRQCCAIFSYGFIAFW